MSVLRRVDAALEGAPDQVLTWGLVGIAGLALVVAIWGRPAFKAAVLAWLAAP